MGEGLSVYRSVVENAVEYIEENLKKIVKVEDVSNYVKISYFHFHRIFFATTGETLGDYIRKRRLTQAACELLNTNNRIIDIAVDYHFESQAAFSRSFKSVYGIMPGTFRKRALQPYINQKKSLCGKNLQHRINQITLQPEITFLDKNILLAGIKGKTSINNNCIPALWFDFVNRMNEIKNPRDLSVAYGVSVVEENYVLHEFTKDTEYFEVVGIEVEDGTNVPDNMTLHEIVSGYYAVFQHRGKAVHVLDTYKYIFGTWVSNSSYELDFRDNFEVYGKDYHGPEDDLSIIRIFISIKKPKV